ncbi:MAG: choice-of-anchor L domain-containing protein [Flavobacteriales bacterium]
MRTNLTILSFILAWTSIQAQIQVSNNAPYNNVTNLVNDVLMSTSANQQANNIDLSTGSASQVGWFNGASSNIGLPEGVIMATGGIQSAINENSQNQYSSNGQDSDLANLTGTFSNATQNNLVILEFDFIAEGSFIEFEYVFGSYEYPDYVCSEFNDLFGFFLSGPGISGPFSNNAKNIALVPDPSNPTNYTNTPVMINTINNGSSGSSGQSSNCSQIDPNWADYSVFFTSNNSNTVAYPGFTKPLKAASEVQCGESYHIKLAICDITDGALTSAVFLKKGSFDLGQPLSIGIADQVNFIKCLDHVVVDPEIEGGFGTLDIEWTHNGNFFSNQTIVNLTDNGTYELTVSDECNEVSHSIVVDDYTQMSLSLPDTLLLCEAAYPNPVLEHGSAEFNYNWSGSGYSSTEANPLISPSPNGWVYLNVTDQCDSLVRDSMWVVSPEALQIDAPETAFLCEGEITIDGSYTGGYGNIQTYWIVNGILQDAQSIVLSVADNGSAEFHVIDDCEHLVHEMEIESPGVYEDMELHLNQQHYALCDRDLFTPDLVVTGGAWFLDYVWTLDGQALSTDAYPILSADSLSTGNHTLNLSVNDQCEHELQVDFTLEKLDCYLPNVFTPNGDLVNDFFFIPTGTYQKNIGLRIYDRWGNEVFASSSYDRCTGGSDPDCWDGTDQKSGKLLNDGIYYYILDFKNAEDVKGSFRLIN